MKDTYCKYFWSHIALFNGKTATPCCRYDHSNKTGGSTVTREKPFTTFTEAIHSQEWKTLRKNSIRGYKEPGCWKCYEEEERGNKSLRQWANEQDDPPAGVTQLNYLEVNLGNYCNLACNICCSDNSNLWYKDDVALKTVGIYKRGEYKPDNNEGITLDVNDYKTVKYMKFVGGEPMIHPKFITMLDFLIEHGFNEQISLQVFTNASWVPKDKIKDRLRKFKKVSISLSIDGIDNVNDYSRWPSKWDVVHESARMWLTMRKEHENVDVRWEPTLSLYNALGMVDAFEWWINLSMEVLEMPLHDALFYRELKDIDIVLNNVMWPEYMTPNLIPNKEDIVANIDFFIKRLYEEHLDETSPRSQYILGRIDDIANEFKKHISAPIDEKHLETFIHFSYDLDKQRGNCLPEQLRSLWEQVKWYGEYSSLKT